MDIKQIMEDADNWRNFKEQLMEGIKDAPVTILKNTQEKDEHLKGYIYDSLVFRYMKARDAEAELERLTQKVSYEASVSQANRDKRRFMEILNEVMGEHD